MRPPPLRSRLAGAAAIVVGIAGVLALAFFAVRSPLHVLVSAVAAALAIWALWLASTRSRVRRLAAGAAFAFAAVALGALVATGRDALLLALAVVAFAAATFFGLLALRWEVDANLVARWHRVPATERSVLFINPRSGDGRAARTHLADEARRGNIETVLLAPGDDLRNLAEAAASRGADALGIAGGDGSQAVVAAVAAAHGLPFVCIPAGTRDHFALDLGILRKDPVRALDAFGPAKETTIDLGEVNGETFVNNVSLGLYARIVASNTYREAKRKTVAEMLPRLVGPGAPPFGLTVDDDGEPVADAQLVLVSNNPYTLSSLAGFGSRTRLDAGTLGVATLSIRRSTDIDRLVALEVAGHPERYEGWRQWTTGVVEVDAPTGVAVAVDGEAHTWEPPLRFVIRPRALRVRIGLDQPGASPALRSIPISKSTLAGLGRVVAGRPSGIVNRDSRIAG